MDKEFVMVQATVVHASLENAADKLSPLVVGLHDMVWTLDHGGRVKLTKEEKDVFRKLKMIHKSIESALSSINVAHDLALEMKAT